MIPFLKKFIFTLLLIGPCLPAIAQQPQDITIEKAILEQINHYRQSHHLPALKMNLTMVKEARQHSKDMATHKNSFGHQGFMERVKRIKSQIKASGGAAENVAFNYRTAQSVVNGWLHSSGHKRNIDGHYRLTGIGVARDSNGRLYFTQLFLA